MMSSIKTGKNGDILQEEADEQNDIQEFGGDIDLGTGEDDVLPPGYE